MKETPEINTSKTGNTTQQHDKNKSPLIIMILTSNKEKHEMSPKNHTVDLGLTPEEKEKMEIGDTLRDCTKVEMQSNIGPVITIRKNLTPKQTNPKKKRFVIEFQEPLNKHLKGQQLFTGDPLENLDLDSIDELPNKYLLKKQSPDYQDFLKNNKIVFTGYYDSKLNRIEGIGVAAYMVFSTVKDHSIVERIEGEGITQVAIFPTDGISLRTTQTTEYDYYEDGTIALGKPTPSEPAKPKDPGVF